MLDAPDSEEPVLLPEDHHDLDAFRSAFAGRAFWCGTALGGCGRQLGTKRYADRVCHFAHLVDRDHGSSACSRDATSADHLYIKAAVHAWLAGHGTEADARLVGPQGRDVEFTAARLRLRIQLTDLTAGQVRGEQERADAEGVQLVWIVHDDRRLPAELPDTGAGALRITCETAGGAAPTRRVLLGWRDWPQPAAWTALEDCVAAFAGAPARLPTPPPRRSRTALPRHLRRQRSVIRRSRWLRTPPPAD